MKKLSYFLNEAKDVEKDSFMSLLDEPEFKDSFTSEVVNYTSEFILTDEYNSFISIPYVDFTYNDEDYGISVDFESAVTINIDKDGKVIKKDIPDIKEFKFKTPSKDKLIVVDDDDSLSKMNIIIKEVISSIKEVAR